MPVPSITSVTPSAGLTGGRLLVEVIGTNFQLPPAPPTTGPATKPNPSVEVLFGTKEGLSVRVLSTTKLHVLTPIADAAVVSLTVRNIDQDGVLIPGETVTLASAFTYARPVLETLASGSGAIDGDVTRVVYTLIKELRRQVFGNVELTVHTDYDDTPDGANVAFLSSLPGLVLSGPALRENRFYSLNAPRTVALGGGQFKQLRAPYTVDLVFTLIGADDNMRRLLNLMREATLFFHRNKVLTMPRDANLPSGEVVEYEMEIEPDGDFDVQPSRGEEANANLRSFSGTFVIRGVDIDDSDMSSEQTSELLDVIITGQAPEHVPSPVVFGGVISTGAPGDPPPLGGGSPPPAGQAYVPATPGTGLVEQKED